MLHTTPYFKDQSDAIMRWDYARALRSSTKRIAGSWYEIEAIFVTGANERSSNSYVLFNTREGLFYHI